MNNDPVLVHFNMDRRLLEDLEREYNKFLSAKMSVHFIPSATIRVAAIVLNEAKKGTRW